MMMSLAIRTILLATAFALAGCGGDGGYGVASTPPPPVTPKPTPATPASTAIIPAATTTQQFSVAGASHGDTVGAPPFLEAKDQLQVRYDASSHAYEIQRPGDTYWGTFFGSSFALLCDSCGVVPLGLRSDGYQFSRLLSWFDGASWGNQAVGISTPSGGVPTTGSANYAGQLLGFTSERNPNVTQTSVDGSILLSFNFGLGSLSGSITPNLHQGYDLGTLNFVNTVYSTGSTTFSGTFDTNAIGINSFSGLFTGPNAQELIGNWALPYQSPIDGKTYQADGAFVGAK
jgi:hypothetical protein